MASLTQEQYNQLLQKGLNDAQIKNLARQKGYDLPSIDGTQKNISTASKIAKTADVVLNPVKNIVQSDTFKNVATGFAKGIVKDVVRPPLQALQGGGQRALAGVLPGVSVSDIQQTTGLKSLADQTPEGQAVLNLLKTEGAAENVGRIGANVASFFVPTGPVLQATGRGLQATGRSITGAGIGLSSKEAPLIQAYKARAGVGERILAALSGKNLARPTTNAETAVKQGLFGTESMIGIQARKASGNIWNDVISPVIKGAKEKVNMPSFIDEIQAQVDNVAELTRKAELQDALNAFKDDYAKVGEVTYEELQKFKEGWVKFIPEKTYKGKPIGSSFREIQNLAADLARNKIYKIFPDDIGKAAYFDYGNLKNLQEFGQKAMTGQKLKGGAGSFISGLYDKVVTPIATTAGLTLYKTGEGLQFVGRNGAKILGDLFK